MTRFPRSLAAGALLALSAAASPADAEPAAKVTIVVSSLVTIDPHRISSTAEEQAVGALFEGLTVVDPSAPEGVAPGVASKWETTPDGLTWTFHLRPEAKWSDGKPVTANDFVGAWSRLLAGDRDFPNAYLLDGLQGGRAFYREQRLSARLFRLSTTLGEMVKGKQGISQDDALVFVDDTGFRSATAHMTDPDVVRFRALDQAVTTGSVKKIQKALELEAAALKKRFDEACARVCKDLGWFAQDDRTFVVQTAAPTKHLLRLLAHPALVPLAKKTLDARRGGFDGYQLPTNGPYVSKGEEPDGNKVRKLVLERSGTYWNAAAAATPKIDVWIDIDDAIDRWKGGEASWLVHDLGSVGLQGRASLDPDALVRLRKEQAAAYYEVPTGVVYALSFRCDRKPFDDVKVRRAVAASVDRRAVAAAVRAATVVPVTRIVPAGVRGAPAAPTALPWAKPVPEKESADARKARLAELKALLGKADLSDGIKMLAFLDATVEPTAGALAKTWEEAFGAYAGSWTLLDRSTPYHADIERAVHHAVLAPLRPAYDDPLAYLELWTSNHPRGATGWKSDAYDALIQGAFDPVGFAKAIPPAALESGDVAALKTAADRAKSGDAQAVAALRTALLGAAERILLDEAVVVPLFAAPEVGVLRPGFRGVDPKKPRVPADYRTWTRLAFEAPK